VEPTTFGAQQSVWGKANVIERQRADLAGTLTHFNFFGSSHDTICVQIDDENGHSTMVCFWVSARKYKANVSDGRIMNPDFASV
jgi:hypothetical protein